MYSVKQLADLASISVRTLHYYDEIGLLTPSLVTDNGYRHYDEANLLRLQQILFYREIGLELTQIKTVLDSPNFDLLEALRSHRRELEKKAERLQDLITTVDNTIIYLSGESTVSKRQLFQAFSDEKQKEYERSARLQYGPKAVNESIKLWNSYSQEKKQAIGEESNQIYSDFIDAVEAGKAPTSPEVQEIVERWHKHLHYFYEPTLEILRGLGTGYNEDPAFNATFTRLHPALPEYLQNAIIEYVDQLETAEIVRMLAEDEEKRAAR
ncbi:MAG: MerR family transcriptional regulator [Anaerolineae bacterium]|nr:MerR family transcriptional regulator [Anaerolineae bacterium]